MFWRQEKDDEDQSGQYFLPQLVFWKEFDMAFEHWAS